MQPSQGRLQVAEAGDGHSVATERAQLGGVAGPLAARSQVAACLPPPGRLVPPGAEVLLLPLARRPLAAGRQPCCAQQPHPSARPPAGPPLTAAKRGAEGPHAAQTSPSASRLPAWSCRAVYRPACLLSKYLRHGLLLSCGCLAIVFPSRRAQQPEHVVPPQRRHLQPVCGGRHGGQREPRLARLAAVGRQGSQLLQEQTADRWAGWKFSRHPTHRSKGRQQTQRGKCGSPWSAVAHLAAAALPLLAQEGGLAADHVCLDRGSEALQAAEAPRDGLSRGNGCDEAGLALPVLAHPHMQAQAPIWCQGSAGQGMQVVGAAALGRDVDGST